MRHRQSLNGKNRRLIFVSKVWDHLQLRKQWHGTTIKKLFIRDIVLAHCLFHENAHLVILFLHIQAHFILQMKNLINYFLP